MSVRRYLIILGLLLTGTTANAQQLPTTLGWFQIPNSSLRSSVPTCAQTPSLCGSEGPSSILRDWGTFAADTNRNRLVSLAGGGHGSYAGNGVYALDLNANPISWVVLKATSTTICNDCDIYPDGTPSSKHGFDGSEYMTSVDKYFRKGAGQFPNGGFGDQWDIFNPVTNTWTEPSIAGNHPHNFSSGVVPASVWDPKLNLIWWDNKPEFWNYNPVTNVWTSIAQGDDNLCGSSTVMNFGIDTKRHIIVCAGNSGGLGKILLDSPYTPTTLGNPAGCGGVGSNVPGIEYDPVRDRMVLWAGGNTIFLFNPDTNTCTSETWTGGPAAALNGTLGKFRYFPKLGGFVFYGSSLDADAALDAPAFFLRIDTPEDTDWVNRSTAAGVIVAQGFDDPTVMTCQGLSSLDSGLYPPFGSGCPSSNLGTLDTSTFSSGTSIGHSSLRFDIPAPSGGASPKGYWKQLFKAAMTGGLAGISTFNPTTPGPFYIQYRQRMTQTYINTGGGSYFKQSIIANDNSTCGNVELTTVNAQNRLRPEMYSQCGGDPFNDSSGGNIYLQQGDTKYTVGFNCIYPSGTGTCFNYPADTWVTYTWKMTIAPGGWGTPTSTVQAWVTLAGQDFPGHMFINQPNHNLQSDAGITGYDSIWLTPYWTGGYSGAVSPDTTWYDELIVSTQPIAAPGFAASTQTAPSVSLPSSASFNPQAVGTTSTSQVITLTNSGTATLSITSISLTGANPSNFSTSLNTCTSTLVAGNSCTINIAFNPLSLASFTASLTFVTNATTSPNNVSLSGSGGLAGFMTGVGKVSGAGIVHN